MAWIKLDDGYYEHRKLADAGPLAECLWTRGLAYCNRYLTDGFVSYLAASRLSFDLLGVLQELDGGRQPEPQTFARALVSAGLWTEDDDAGGYHVHDYGEWQRSADAIRLLGEKRAVAGRKGAASRWQDGKEDGKAIADAWQSDSRPIAEPEPEPELLTVSTVSSPPVPRYPAGEGNTSDRVLDACLALEVTQRANGSNPVQNPPRWTVSMRQKRWGQWGADITRLLDEFPTAPDNVLAAAIVNGEKHSLRYYAEGVQ